MLLLMLQVTEIWSYLATKLLRIPEKHQVQFDEQLRIHIECHHNDEAKAMLSQHLKEHDDYETLLHHAAHCGNEVIVRELIKLGAKIDCLGSNGDTPLMVAIKAKHTSIVEALLEENANVDLANAAGISPLQMMYDSQLDNLEIIEMIQYAIQSKSSGVEELVDKLISSGCTLNHAAFLKNKEVLERMLERGLHVNFSQSGNLTEDAGLEDVEDDCGTLIVVAARENEEMVQFLLERSDGSNAEDFFSHVIFHTNVQIYKISRRFYLAEFHKLQGDEGFF